MGSRTVVDRPMAVVNAVNTASPVMRPLGSPPAGWWVSVDHLHRPIKMTDAAKAAVWTAVWQPWGSPQSLTGTATLDARFPGQWFQMEAGLAYNWHRSYDPTLGRYTQPDPLGFVDGPSVYGYAIANPQGYVDRDGRQVTLPIPHPIVWVPPIIAICYKVIKDWINSPPTNDNSPPGPRYCKATSLTGQTLSGGRLQCTYKCPPNNEIVIDTSQERGGGCRPFIKKDLTPTDVPSN